MQIKKFFKIIVRTGIILFLVISFECSFGQGVDLKDLTGLGQTVDLKELTGLLDMSKMKLEAHLQKRGFKRDYYADQKLSFIRQDKKEKKFRQSFLIEPSENDYVLTYQTRSADEYLKLKEELILEGFTRPLEQPGTSAVLYQRWGTRIESSIKSVDSTVWYELKATRKTLPKWKDLLYAEDLLQLDAHQYLAAVFGKENIKTDLFYFTETETNRCSVLYPNSDREVIFVWNDEQNLKDIAFILIGGSLRPKDKIENINAVAPNSWHSKQGISCGMSLRELQKLNKEQVRFYNWHTESAGYLAPGNRGVLDFNNLSIIFNCLNCGFTNISHESVVDSYNAIEENLKVFVNSMIILPEKRNR